MKVVWEYNLPTSESSKDGLYECPVFIKNDHIYFISELNHKCHLHIIDVDSGVGKVEDIPVRKSRIPSEFFFTEHKERLFLYTDDIYIYEH